MKVEIEFEVKVFLKGGTEFVLPETQQRQLAAAAEAILTGKTLVGPSRRILNRLSNGRNMVERKHLWTPEERRLVIALPGVVGFENEKASQAIADQIGCTVQAVRSMWYALQSGQTSVDSVTPARKRKRRRPAVALKKHAWTKAEEQELMAFAAAFPGSRSQMIRQAAKNLGLRMAQVLVRYYALRKQGQGGGNKSL